MLRAKDIDGINQSHFDTKDKIFPVFEGLIEYLQNYDDMDEKEDYKQLTPEKLREFVKECFQNPDPKPLYDRNSPIGKQILMGIVQDSCDKIRALRKETDSLRKTFKREIDIDGMPLTYTREVFINLSNLKMRLGNTLKELSNIKSPYEEAANRRRNGSSDEIPPEVDTSEPAVIGPNMSKVDIVDGLRAEIKDIQSNIKEIHKDLSALPAGHFAFVRLESALVSADSARNWLGMILGEMSKKQK